MCDKYIIKKNVPVKFHKVSISKVALDKLIILASIINLIDAKQIFIILGCLVSQPIINGCNISKLESHNALKN